MKVYYNDLCKGLVYYDGLNCITLDSTGFELRLNGIKTNFTQYNEF